MRTLDYEAITGRTADPVAFSWLPYCPIDAAKAERAILVPAGDSVWATGLTSCPTRVTSFEERGLSQGQLGEAAGLSISEISRIERGAREVRLTTMARLLAALGAAPDELFRCLTLPTD